MHVDDRLDALLDQWDQARAAGKALTPADLCRDAPELLPELECLLVLLSRFDSLRSDEPASTADRPPAHTTALPDPPATQDAPPAAPPPALPAVGAEFDGYRIVAELGRGGMGRVLRAANPVLKRDEALKVMLPEMAARPEARERFLREARALAAVRHDHVVEVYHVREAEGIPYLAMPLLAGETLWTRLEREKPLPPAEVLRIGREIADGLAAAHARRLIHRDVKPANIWLEAPGAKVKILDFGLARAAQDDAHLTRTGVIVGTPPYVSPEQVNGEALDPRSDLFSVGSVLYECATGRAAFPGATDSAVLSAVAQKDPPAARSVNPDVPAGLSDLIADLLRKAPGKRPATALELSRRLRALETGGSAVHDGATTEYEPSSRRRRWPWWAAAACLLGMALFGAVAVHRGWLANGREENTPTLTEPRPNTAVPAVPLQVLKIDVHHFARKGKDEAEARGLIGERSFAATSGDQVTLEAKLSRPAYAYLIAFRPDGVAEVCWPESEEEPPPLTDRLRYPAQDRSVRYGLSDGVGLMVFAVVASDRPLPAYREWAAQNPPVWRPAEGAPGEVWWDDGSLLDTLTPAGPAPVDRAKGEQALGRSAAVVRLTDALRKTGRTDAVGCLGFVVRQP